MVSFVSSQMNIFSLGMNHRPTDISGTEDVKGAGGGGSRYDRSWKLILRSFLKEENDIAHAIELHIDADLRLAITSARINIFS